MERFGGWKCWVWCILNEPVESSKERNISMLDRCRIIVRYPLVQCTCIYIYIWSPYSGIPIEVYGV